MRVPVFAFCFTLFTGFASAQPSIKYRLGLDNIVHHELKVDIIFSDIRKDTLSIRMPNASPGRYAEHNFVKNLYEEQAYGENGETVNLLRTSPYTWKVPVTNGYVRFSYTLFGNHADGTYTGIDYKKLHMNMPATFAYGEGLEQVPVNLIIDLAEKPTWTVGTQLVKINDSTFSAPNYYYFYDSPTMAGEIDWRSWKVDHQTIEVAMMHEGTEAELDEYVEWIKKIVTEEKEIYGELPEFDYGRYTFLITYNPWVYGDGMEHRNSTICSSNGNLAAHADALIGTVAHEFFHAWNIERIRPKSLEPFDFRDANLSGALWFGEGFTSYYDDLTLVRADILSAEEYVKGLTGTMNYVVNSPGRLIRNPIQMSYNAPFVDAATANDETNYPNNFISYYSYGAVLGLGLDLMLRTTFDDVVLDDYMRYVWEEFGEPEKTYTINDLQNALATVTGDAAFAKSFFEGYIYASVLPDFEKLFIQFGIRMEPVNPSGTDLSSVKLDNIGTITSSILRNTSLYAAGVEKGNQLLSIAGQQVSTHADLKKIAQSLEHGKSYKVVYKQLGETISSSFTAQADPAFRLVYLPDNEVSKNVKAKRSAWLKGK